ncbi:MAG: hypothetical protein JO112_10320 [Planctomycetes bacterium]|nr:hypothetical protein [Planctomycetota bacterium]
MTEREFVQKAFEIIAQYSQTVSPKEGFQQMVARGIINEKGEVLVTQKEREAGHPLDDESEDGLKNR